MRYSEPYTIPARQWQAFAQGTHLRLSDGPNHYGITSADYTDDGVLLICCDNGSGYTYSLDDEVTVVAPRVSFSDILNR